MTRLAKRRAWIAGSLVAAACVATSGRAQGGPGPELWVVLNGPGEIAVVDIATGSVDPTRIDISDPDGDRVIDPPWGLAFSKVPGFHGTHAFVSQQEWITVIEVSSRTVLRHFRLTDWLPATSLDVRGCFSSIPRQFNDPAGGPVIRSLLHCAATDGAGDALFVVLDQETLIDGPVTANPVVDDGTLAGAATGLDVVVQDTPRGPVRFQRAWYTVERAGAVNDELLGIEVSTSDTLPFAFRLDTTRTFAVGTGTLPGSLAPSAPTGGELPAIPLGSLGRLENLESGGGCDIGGDPVAVSVTGFGVGSYTVLSLDGLTDELHVVNAVDCSIQSFAVGANPVDLATLGWIRWRSAWVANFDDDTITQLDDDGTLTTIALGPPPGAACSECPISVGVTERDSEECDGIAADFDKVDTNQNNLIDRIVITWTPIGCDSITEFTIGCRCDDENDVTCPCACDCSLPQPPIECLCPGIQGVGGDMPNDQPLQLLTPSGGETPWIILGNSPGGGGGVFNHDIPDGNTSDIQYNLEPKDPGN